VFLVFSIVLKANLVAEMNRRASNLFKKKHADSEKELVVSAPSIASPTLSSSIPDDLESQFLLAAKKLGMPLASAQALSVEKKWQLVQEVARNNTKTETEESFVKRLDMMLSTKKISLPSPGDVFQGSSVAWIENVVSRGDMCFICVTIV
jgi:hypothetical protein